MSLTSADVQRLEGRGLHDVCREDAEGVLRLATTADGHCIFLSDAGECTVYPDRPEGCVLYPLIYYTHCGEVGLDEFCPHRHEFRFSAGDAAWLERSIATEDAEVRRRLRARGSMRPRTGEQA